MSDITSTVVETTITTPVQSSMNAQFIQGIAIAAPAIAGYIPRYDGTSIVWVKQTEEIDDQVAALIKGGTNIGTPVYDDGAGTLTISVVDNPTFTGGVTVDLAADGVGLRVQAASGQTSNIFVVEDSVGADHFTMDSAGQTSFAQQATFLAALVASGGVDGIVGGVTPAAGTFTALSATSITGTLQTAVQPNLTTLAALALPWGQITSTPTTLAGYGITDGATDTELAAHTSLTNNPHSVTQAQVGLGSVENTALSTWAGSSNITVVGTLLTLQVDNLNLNGNTLSSTAGVDLLITPLAGQQIVLDGAVVIDAGVITGVTSLTSTSFVGALTGNAATATALATARTINGVNFDGGANITVTAAAGTLSGATLASGVTASSLTSLGTLASLAVAGAISTGAAPATSGSGLRLTHGEGITYRNAGNTANLTGFGAAADVLKLGTDTGWASIAIAAAGVTTTVGGTLAVTENASLLGSITSFTNAAGPVIRLTRDDVNDYRFDIATDGTNLTFTPQDSGGFVFAAGGGTGNATFAGNVTGAAGSFTTLSASGAATFLSDNHHSGNIYFTAAQAQAHAYLLTDETGTGTGIVTIQAGGGSAGFGGSLHLYAHAHATKPGDVVAGISSASGGSFRVNATGVDTGADWLTVGSTAATFTGSVTGQAASFTTGAFSSTLAVTGVSTLTGGITGGIKLVNGPTGNGEVFRDNATTFIRISGGSAASLGGAILMYGQTHATKPGEIDLTGNTTLSGITSITNTTQATSTTLASLKTAGGLAVAKDFMLGGKITSSNADDFLSLTSSVQDPFIVMDSTFGTATGRPGIVFRADGANKAFMKWDGTNFAFTLADITMDQALTVGGDITLSDGNVALTSTDLGAGAAGHSIAVGRNSNATPGAGFLSMTRNSGPVHRLWVDSTGVYRIHSADPTNANDTAGTVVGTQTSDYRIKYVGDEFTDYAFALHTVVTTPIWSWTHLHGSHRLRKGMVGYVIYEKDRGGWFSCNDHRPDNLAALDQANMNGYFGGAIIELAKRTNSHEDRIATLEAENIDLKAELALLKAA